MGFVKDAFPIKRNTTSEPVVSKCALARESVLCYK